MVLWPFGAPKSASPAALRKVNDPAPYRFGGRLCPILNTQLTQNALHVVLYGVFAQTQRIRNLLVYQAEDDQLQNLQLARGQIRAGPLSRDGHGKRGRNIGLSGVNRANRLQQFVMRNVFRQIGLHSRGERTPDVLVSSVSGKRDNSGAVSL